MLKKSRSSAYTRLPTGTIRKTETTSQNQVKHVTHFQGHFHLQTMEHGTSRRRQLRHTDWQHRRSNSITNRIRTKESLLADTIHGPYRANLQCIWHHHPAVGVILHEIDFDKAKFEEWIVVTYPANGDVQFSGYLSYVVLLLWNGFRKIVFVTAVLEQNQIGQRKEKRREDSW